MSKIPENFVASIFIDRANNGQLPVKVNKWGSVKVQVCLRGNTYSVSRNELAKKIDKLCCDSQKKNFMTIFEGFNDDANQQLGKKFSFKRFSHGVRSLFGKVGFNFRKAMKQWEEKINNNPTEITRDTLIDKWGNGSQHLNILKDVKQLVESDKWDVINDFVNSLAQKMSKTRRVGKLEAIYDKKIVSLTKDVLDLAVQKKSPYQGKFLLYLSKVTINSQRVDYLLKALSEKHPDAAVYLNLCFPKVEKLENVLGGLESLDPDNTVTNTYTLGQMLYIFSYWDLQCMREPKNDLYKEKYEKSCQLAYEKGSGYAAWLLAVKENNLSERKKYFDEACERKNPIALCIAKDEDAKTGFLNLADSSV